MLVKSFHLFLIVRCTIILLLVTILLVMMSFYYESYNIVPNPLHYNFSTRMVKQYDEKYEFQIALDFEKQVPLLGYNGEASFLEGDAKVIGDEQIKVIGVNEELSDHISYDRTMPDTRHEFCKEEIYDVVSLPSISMIIVFYDEPYSILLRTIHSALNTIPEEVLKEIIVIDDASTMDILTGKLKYYIETRLPDFVTLYRLPKR